jgi:serine/threonine protein kinase
VRDPEKKEEMAAERFRGLLTSASQYTLGNMIGCGVFGDNYVASDRRYVDTILVVKRFDQPLTNMGRLSFLNEIVFPCMIDSCHVMLPRGIICDEKKIVGFTTPFYSRGTIGHQVIGSLSPTELSTIIFGVAATMSQLHSLGIVHRDLQPFSVYINSNGEPVIADFALAGFADSKPHAPPRSQLFSASDLAGDVYSFGMLVYSLFEQPAPLDGRCWETTLRKVANGARFGKTDRVPDSMWPLIERCWAHRPEERPTFEDIMHILGEEMVVPGTDIEKYGEYRKRRMAEIIQPAVERNAHHILIETLGWKKGKQEEDETVKFAN